MNPESDQNISYRIKIAGLVQGVGFRPFVYRLARWHGISGWVMNGTDGITIQAQGREGNLRLFMDDLYLKAPVVSRIEKITFEQAEEEPTGIFTILESQDLTDETSEVSPDISVCPDCLEDMKQQPRRHDYPFINCTNCGPRFSIIMDFPYDRSRTTMAPFTMCPACRKEYEDMDDRRFHAQPVACRDCGPAYTLYNGERVMDDPDAILGRVCELLTEGAIIAVKGTGGYHLMCDALKEDSVSRLRLSKQREGKAFAVMFRDLESIREYASVSAGEESALLSWQRPIVILSSKRKLAEGVSMGLGTTGAFLPYMPFHHLLFERLRLPALVLTSGNLAEEPIITDDEKALSVLGPVVDAVLTYNRIIYNRNDDSVLQVIGMKTRMIRRSRGYVPFPLHLAFDVNGIFAAGAELSNCFCIGKGNRAYLSQHIGDLKNAETYGFYVETAERFKRLFRVQPSLAAADLHPDYLSTRYANSLGLPVIRVQHHHAHIASCMAENGENERVVGLAFDGTGYGNDGNTWGGEFLVCGFDDFIRAGHFEYMAMPGGDRAAEEPWRMGISLLHQAYGMAFSGLSLPLLKTVARDRVKLILTSLERGINCPLTSSAGRLFDGVAAITGLCLHARFHAEAPMRLESAIATGVEDFYEFDLSADVSFTPAIRQICGDVMRGTPAGVISARFHNTVAEASLRMTRKVASSYGIRKVALSGGSFQNRYLSARLERMLAQEGFTVLTHGQVPCNDGGLALGQLAVAALRRKQF